MFLSSGPERAGWEGGQHGGQERWWGRRVRVLLTCEARWGFVPVRCVGLIQLIHRGRRR